MLHERLFPTCKGIWKPVNLNDEARTLVPPDRPNPLLDPGACEGFVNLATLHRKAHYTYGGYRERRDVLWRGHRYRVCTTTHLGVDYNVPAGTPVMSPALMRLIMAEREPDGGGGWGGRLIFSLQAGGYLLVAHLGDMSLRLGHNYHPGQYIGEVGQSHENGGWYPHLHLQCMRDYEPGADGYADLADDEIARRFPDPEVVLA